MLVASALFGIAVSIKFVIPDFLGGTQPLTWGLLRVTLAGGTPACSTRSLDVAVRPRRPGGPEAEAESPFRRSAS